MREEITVSRDCKAIQIPSGYEVNLRAGLNATIVQSLGGAFTLITEDGMMVRVSGENVTAIGKEAEAVAHFVAKYAGEEAESSPRPGEEASP